MSYESSLQFSLAVSECVDSNGAVSSYNPPQVTGNGLLYNSMAIILSTVYFKDYTVFEDSTFAKYVAACLKDHSLNRTPDGKFGPETFDDCLGLAAASIMRGDTSLPRILLFSNKKYFWRSIPTWVLVILGAFPILKWLGMPFAYLVGLLVKADPSDASAVNLAFVYHATCHFLYGGTLDTNLAAPFKAYFGPTHPFTILVTPNA